MESAGFPRVFARVLTVVLSVVLTECCLGVDCDFARI